MDNAAGEKIKQHLSLKKLTTKLQNLRFFVYSKTNFPQENGLCCCSYSIQNVPNKQNREGSVRIPSAVKLAINSLCSSFFFFFGLCAVSI